MDTRQHEQADRLILFGRYPVPGQTKTRLIPALGPAGAAELQRRLTEKTLRAARRAALKWGASLEVRFDGGSEERMRRWLGPGLVYSDQGPGDLGRRMEVALLDAIQQGSGKAVLFGTDIPGLRARHLGQALEALVEKDLVLGPTEDGGYWLVGLKRPADIFHNMVWGTGDVFDRTVARARARGLSVHSLERQRDLDTTEDLGVLRDERTGRYLTVIIPALNEGASIKDTIRCAQSEDAEIVVVDGGSRDDTVPKATEMGVHVLIGPRGRAAQQNRGAMEAGGEVLLFLHADTRLPRDYVEEVFESLMNPKVALGSFCFKTDLKGPLMRSIECMTNLRSKYLRLPYGDQGLFIRRHLFKSAGGFPDVPIAEDLLFVRRLSKLGRVATVSAEAVTSGRRWRNVGPLRTFLINQVIVFGLVIGTSPRVLASIYRSAGAEKRGL